MPPFLNLNYGLEVETEKLGPPQPSLMIRAFSCFYGFPGDLLPNVIHQYPPNH